MNSSLKTIKELKQELFEALKSSETLESYRDVIFSDTNGEIFSWATNDLDELEALLGVRKFPARLKCATLSWHTFLKALNNPGQPCAHAASCSHNTCC